VATIEELKQQIDLHDLAEKLDWVRPDSTGNYKSPHRDDKNPSVSIFNNGKAFKDHTDGAKGSCIDMVMYHFNCDAKEAIKILHEFYNIPLTPQKTERRDKSLAEFIVDKCFDAANLEMAVEYLVQERGLPESTVRQAINNRTVGFNNYTSNSKQPGQRGYGGPGVAFPVISLNPGHVVGVDIRYLDPENNGGQKTQYQGSKTSPWVMDPKRFKYAHVVYAVESSINALSVEACGIGGAAAFSFLGTENVLNIDYHFLQGKKVVICGDYDKPDEKTNIPPGAKAAWALYDQLASLNIAAHFVDQTDWEHNDVNDILQAEGVEELRKLLQRYDPYILPGVHGDYGKQNGKARVYLPIHDSFQYWRYRAKEDFVNYVEEFEVDQENDNQKKAKKFKDVCGFRIAAISRVSIASATSTMTGEKDAAPRVLFSVSVQTPRHANKLQRKVFEDERLHNVDQWKKFGPVFAPSNFLRMVNILERGADLGARDAVNFVGLAWRDGRLIVNEGTDCYFTEPEQQCPYHNLVFPTGSLYNARRVIEEYQKTFKENAATIPLVWILGAHLKVLLGFWPHISIQAEKGSGKSTLIKRLERTTAMTMFSNESIKSAFRLLTSVSYTSHPVGWEEMSANNQKVIDEAVSMLQQAYQYTPTKRGSAMTEYLICAPVMLAGEDVPVRSLIGKLVGTDLSGARKGPMLPQDLPKFPIREWLQFLTQQTRENILEKHSKAVAYCWEHCRVKDRDSGANRMVENYAAINVAWSLLCEFVGIDKNQGGFISDMLLAMNKHIAETSGDREPWVWIMETILHEIAGGHYRGNFLWTTVKTDSGEREDALCLRTNEIMHHLSTETRLRAKFDGLPIKSNKPFREALDRAGVLVATDVEKVINNRRVGHLVAIGLEAMEKYGLHATPPELIEEALH